MRPFIQNEPSKVALKWSPAPQHISHLKQREGCQAPRPHLGASHSQNCCHYCCCLRRGQIVRCDGVRQFKYRLIRSGQNSRLDQVITDEDFAVNKRRETDRMRLLETSGQGKYHVDKRLQ